MYKHSWTATREAYRYRASVRGLNGEVDNAEGPKQDEKQSRMFELAGKEFNPGSAQQVSTLLFKTRGLKPPPNAVGLASGRPSASFEVLNAMLERSGEEQLSESDRELINLIMQAKRKGKAGGVRINGEKNNAAVAVSPKGAATQEGGKNGAEGGGGARLASDSAIKSAIEARPPHLLLIDGTYLIHRAYYAMASPTAPLTSPAGELTGPLLTFCNTINKAVLVPASKGIQTRVVVAFDNKSSWRREVFPVYKGQRKESTRELKAQFPLALEACNAFGLTTVSVDGFEADDLIATFAKNASDAGFDTVVATADKDIMQLVSDKVHMLDPFQGKRITPAEVREKTGVEPHQVGDYLALTGDQSDNLPGVPSIGPKTAAALLNEHFTLDAVLEAAAATPEAKRSRRDSALLKGSASALLTKELVKLVEDVPTPFQITEVEPYQLPTDQQRQILMAFFDKMGFRELRRRTEALMGMENNQTLAGKENAIEREQPSTASHQPSAGKESASEQKEPSLAATVTAKLEEERPPEASEAAADRAATTDHLLPKVEEGSEKEKVEAEAR